MKVLFQSYYDFGRMYGGGPSVLYSLADELRNLGVEVTLHDYWKHDSKNFDLVHYFSCYGNMHWLLHRLGDPPLVVTPISWFEFPLLKRLETKIKYLARVVRHRTADRRRLGYPFSVPARFYPNSEGEAFYLTESYAVPRELLTIVPHGVPDSFQYGDSTLFERKFGLRDFVLCVGRFEYPRKNQLALIQAFKHENIQLVFIGGPELGHEGYYQKCRSEASSSTLFLPPMEKNSPLLISAYHACKVIVMPSLLESPGLVGLEGGISGANVATTQNGSTREYFSTHAWYFDPTDLESIRENVLNACDAPRGEALRARILERYTWSKIARGQKTAYEDLLSHMSSEVS